MQSSARKFALALAVGVALFSALPSGAVALDSTEAQQALFDMNLSPPAVYPTALPQRLASADVEVNSLSDGYVISWTRPNEGNPDVNDGYQSLDRSSTRSLRSELRSIRRESKVTKVKIGRQTAYRACGHVCGHLWSSNGQTFRLFGLYYEDSRLQPLFSDQRAIIRSLAPVQDQG